MIKNLKKPCVFPDFWLHIALHKAQETQESTLKSTQRKTVSQKKESNLENKTYKKLETTWIPIFDTEAHKKKP